MGTKTTVEERLNDQLNAAEARIEELESQIEASKYEDEWNWRHFRKLSKEENLGLPIPRLEIRNRKLDSYNCVSDYGLVYRHFDNEVLFAPLGSTRIGGSNTFEQTPLRLPFREGANIYHDMSKLKLRGFVTCGKELKEMKSIQKEDTYE